MTARQMIMAKRAQTQVLLRHNNFETGLASGTALTLANSDDGTAGDAFDAIAGTLTYRTTNPGQGTTCLEAGSNSYVSWTALARTTLGGSGMFRLSALPGSTHRLVQIRNAAAVTVVGIDVDGSGNIGFFGSAGTEITETVAAVVGGDWFRVEWELDAVAGAWEVRLYDDTFVESISGTGASIGADYSAVRIGSTNIAATTFMDALELWP